MGKGAHELMAERTHESCEKHPSGNGYTHGWSGNWNTKPAPVNTALPAAPKGWNTKPKKVITGEKGAELYITKSGKKRYESAGK